MFRTLIWATMVALLVVSCAPAATTQHEQSPTTTAPDELKAEIDKLGYKTRQWKHDGASWILSTEYNTIGSPGNFMQNNLAFYLTSDVEDRVKKLKLILNLNNPDERKQALDTFIQHSKAAASWLNQKLPSNFEQSVTDFKPIEGDKVMLKTDKGPKTSSYDLIIYTE